MHSSRAKTVVVPPKRSTTISTGVTTPSTTYSPSARAKSRGSRSVPHGLLVIGCNLTGGVVLEHTAADDAELDLVGDRHRGVERRRCLTAGGSGGGGGGVGVARLGGRRLGGGSALARRQPRAPAPRSRRALRCRRVRRSQPVPQRGRWRRRPSALPVPRRVASPAMRPQRWSRCRSAPRRRRTRRSRRRHLRSLGR